MTPGQGKIEIVGKIYDKDGNFKQDFVLSGTTELSEEEVLAVLTKTEGEE